MASHTDHRFRSRVSYRGALALMALLFLLFGARCAQTGEGAGPPPESAGSTGGAQGAEGMDEVTSAGGEMDTEAPAPNVVVYFVPELDVRAEDLAFVIRPAKGSKLSPEKVSEQAAALNARLARSGVIEISPVFGESAEDVPPAFDVALPEETSEAAAEALAEDLGESPLVDEAYVSAVGTEPGVGEPGLP